MVVHAIDVQYAWSHRSERPNAARLSEASNHPGEIMRMVRATQFTGCQPSCRLSHRPNSVPKGRRPPHPSLRLHGARDRTTHDYCGPLSPRGHAGARRIRPGETLQPWRFLHLRDPDGHGIELFPTHYQTIDIEDEPIRWQAPDFLIGGRKTPSDRLFNEATAFA